MKQSAKQLPVVTDSPSTEQRIGGGFSGADQLDRQIASWQPAQQSADGALLDVKDDLDAKTIEMGGNDGYVAAAADKYRDSIVGSRFKLNAAPDKNYLTSLGFSDAMLQDFADEVESKFTLWAESPNHWVDAAGVNTFTGLLRVAVGSQYPQHGEILATAEWLRDGRPMSTAIQMVDPARLSNPPTQPERANFRGGRETNRWGRARRYHIREGHPHDPHHHYRLMKWRAVPAFKPWGRKQVIHILEQRRTDQSRGYGALVAALKSIRTRKKLTDMELQNVALNAMYAAALETDLPPEVASAIMGGDEDENGDSAAYGNLIKQITQVLGGKSVYLDGVKVPMLPPGTKLRMQRAAAAANSQFSFEASLLRHEARTTGMSYEEYSGDYTKTNMASATRAIAETRKFMSARKAFLADPLATDIYALWLEESISKGTIESLPPSFDVLAFNSGLNKEALTKCTWLGAPKPVIDPFKAAMANRIMKEDGILTDAKIAADASEDWREIYDQRKREQDYADSIGLRPTDSAKSTIKVVDKDDDDDEGDDDNGDDKTGNSSSNTDNNSGNNND
jgi:lambda family phage portal protein